MEYAIIIYNYMHCNLQNFHSTKVPWLTACMGKTFAFYLLLKWKLVFTYVARYVAFAFYWKLAKLLFCLQYSQYYSYLQHTSIHFYSKAT